MELNYEIIYLSLSKGKKKEKEQQTTIVAGFTQILVLSALGFGVQSSNSAFKAKVLASAFAT